MTNYSDERDRDFRVILAWIILALQIIGLLWLLLFARDRLAAWTGQDAGRGTETTAVVEATTVPEATSAPAATEMSEPTTAPETTSGGSAEDDVEDANIAVIDPEDVTVDSSAVAPDWLATLVQGSTTSEASDQSSIPPHILLTFPDPAKPDQEAAEGEAIDLNKPQLRIIPISTLLALLRERDDEASQQALQDLLRLLEERPDIGEAAIPVPPVLGQVEQNFVSRATYKPFGGGSGVGYVTNITGEDVTPVTNESGLNYVYQGLTADGEQYVFMSWPLDASFLPETAADASGEAEALAASKPSYFDGLRGRIEAAADSDLIPSISSLSRLLTSLSIGGQTVAVAEDTVVSGWVEDAAGFTWYWTGITDASGEVSEVENPQDYSLVLWPDGAYSIKADCNVGSGSYTSGGEGSIRINPGPLSRAQCPPDSRDADFVGSLLAARTIGFNESGDMILGLEDGSAMTFANVGDATADDIARPEGQPGAADAGFTGITLQWPGFTNADGETVSVENPEDYLLTLLPDGRFNIVADCNIGGGSYTYGDDGSLQLGPIRTTRAACRDGSLGDEFVSFLEDVDAVTVAPDGTVTMTTTGGGSATFISGGPVSESGEPAVAGESEDPLVGATWQWISHTHPTGSGDLFVEDPESYLLLFMSDGSYNITADCNFGRGDYNRDGIDLALEPPALTRAACAPESLGDDFTQFLERVQRYTITESGDLELHLDNDGLMTFRDGGRVVQEPTEFEPQEQSLARDAGLTGIALQWPGFTDRDGNVVAADNPEDYSLILFPDGTYTAKAGCNIAGGTFAYNDDGTMTLTPGLQTLAACADGSRSEQFFDFLKGVEGLIIGDNGDVTMYAGGSSATFVNLGEVEIDAAESTESSTAQPTPDGDPLNTVWQWTSVTPADGDAAPVDNPDQYYLVLIDDGTYAFRADCNNGAGSYELDGEALTVLPAAVTLAECGEGSLSGDFVDYLNRTTSYGFDEDGNLILTLDDGTVLTFANGGPFEGLDTGTSAEPTEAADPLSGTTWQWTHFRDAKQDYDVAGDYTITFNADGTAAMVADCNTGSGSHSLRGADGLTIRIAAVTAAACPAGSLGGSFLEYLNQAGTYVIDNGVLTLELMADGGTMTFSAVP